jgi:hypothetical protein
MLTYRHRLELDRFQPDAAASAEQGLCEGECADDGDCRGSVHAVRVVHTDGTDWGWFAYCEEARAIDFERGFFFPEAA